VPLQKVGKSNFCRAEAQAIKEAVEGPSEPLWFIEALSQMYDDKKKHILKQGEYFVSLKQQGDICRKAGFVGIIIMKVPHYIGIVVAGKSL
jgi:hypothetical protein